VPKRLPHVILLHHKSSSSPSVYRCPSQSSRRSLTPSQSIRPQCCVGVGYSKRYRTPRRCRRWYDNSTSTCSLKRCSLDEFGATSSCSRYGQSERKVRSNSAGLAGSELATTKALHMSIHNPITCWLIPRHTPILGVGSLLLCRSPRAAHKLQVPLLRSPRMALLQHRTRPLCASRARSVLVI
jgi:hypothetical protein